MQVDVVILDPRLKQWGFPHWGSTLAAGLDLHACLDEPLLLHAGAGPTLVSAGFSMRMGESGCCGLVAPRSGAGHRGLVLGNTIGIIDADYEGPLMLSCWNRNGTGEPIVIAPGERVAQLLFLPVIRPALVEISGPAAKTVRGSGGFGSTGRGGNS